MKNDDKNEVLRSTGEIGEKQNSSDPNSIGEKNNYTKNKPSPYYVLRALEKSGELWGWGSFASCFITAFGSTIYYLIQKDAWLVKLIVKLVAIDFFLILATSVLFIISTELLKVNSYRSKTGVRDIGLVFADLYVQSKTIHTRLIVKSAFFLLIMSGLEFGFAMGASVFIGFNRSVL